MTIASGSTHAAPAAAPHGRLLTALLAACTAVGPVSTLILLPALPAIREEFGTSTAATQAAVSAFLIAFALGIPVSGPLSDRYGRRPLLLGGLLLFAVGSALAAVAPNLPMLIAARVVQAIGAAANLTVARAVVGDIYHDWRLPRALAQLTMVMMVATTVAPWLGAVATDAFGWHAPFFVLLGFAAVVFVAVLRLLPETRVARSGELGLAALGRASFQVLRNPRFVGCAIDSGVVYALYLGFVSVAPYIMSEMLGRPATDFGVYVLLLSAGYFLGNLYIARQAQAIDMGKLARTGTMLQFVSALAALGFVAVGLDHPLYWFLPQLPLAFAQGLIMPHVTAVAVRMVPGYAGIASSLLGFSQQVIAASVVQALGFLPTSTPLPMLGVCAVLALVSLVATVVLRKASEQGVAPS